ncbi:MAG: radical SAM/Cys-rich domain protein [Deltaproteobacteria bacterium]|nr:radical SAM/Cys-rich domain protein [Deltaproteobacteria bacterium]NIS77192.1 radical SAM/Cys-rich domain protein [Deltaproteobacteria bacterium]
MEPNAFEKRIAAVTGGGLTSKNITIIQVNLGLLCNQECSHCHLHSSPVRREVMSWSTMRLVIDAVKKTSPSLVDITGGAPELNPHFERFVDELDSMKTGVQVRTNLTVMFEEGKKDLPDFFRANGIHLVASLPCYLEENVDTQRGRGSYGKSIEALLRLNDIGYGIDPDLPLNLVYNPGGPFLPPPQETLEEDYRKELGERYGIKFTSLLTITNMPIGRYLTSLKRENRLESYMKLLKKAFNPDTLEGLMCRQLISIAWDGRIYDCDFNLAIGLSVDHGAPDHITRFETPALKERRIVTGEHCFGCTAGSGSSCQGALL